MFTKNNTMNEILNTEPVGRAAGNLFPTCFMGTRTGGTQGSYDGTD